MQGKPPVRYPCWACLSRGTFLQDGVATKQGTQAWPITAFFFSCCFHFTFEESKALRGCFLPRVTQRGCEGSRSTAWTMQESQGPGRGGILIVIFLSLSFFLSWLTLFTSCGFCKFCQCEFSMKITLNVMFTVLVFSLPFPYPLISF